MSDEFKLREALCEIGRRVWKREYVAANDGNFSVRLSPDEILCTPTMVSKGFMSPDEMVVVSPVDGRLMRGRSPATSEIKMHLEIYRHRPDVQSVVHVHPPHATAFALVRQPLPKCVLPESEVFLGEVSIAEYETPGTQKFAETVTPFLQQCDAFLLASHGAVTVGRDPFEAYYRMETLDQYCRILLLARQLGDLNQLDAPRVRELLDIRKRLGFRDTRSGLPDTELCRIGVTPAGPGGSTGPGTEREVIEEIVRQVMLRLGQG